LDGSDIVVMQRMLLNIKYLAETAAWQQQARRREAQ